MDSYGSVFKKYLETGEFDENEIYSYLTEGIGEDILPENVKFDLIDHFEKVTDKDGALSARELASKEGLFLGYSCGSAMQALRQMKNELKPGDLQLFFSTTTVLVTLQKFTTTIGCASRFID